MSLAAVASRVQELQALIDRPVGAPAAAPAPAVTPTAAEVARSPFAAEMQAAFAAATPTGAGALGAADPSAYDGLIQEAAARHGVDPALLKGLIRAESGFDPNAGSPAGAQGLAQLMPGTAASLGVTDPFDPAQSIEGGAKYLGQQLRAFGGDPSLALAAYNAGPGAVQRHGGIPPYAETRTYVQRVLAYAEGYR
jgi:soluble lytic murein transglycosylase-like protein